MKTKGKKSGFWEKFIRIIILTAALVIKLALVTDARAAPGIGDIIPFGGMDWRVLDVQGNKALIITENVIEQRPYNMEPKAATWETCTLRKYLNGELYAKFSKEDQERITETRISNPDNLWYGTKGGADTTDKVFLLSLEEVDKYFGDSGDYLNKNRKKYIDGKLVPANDGFGFSNANDSERIAKYDNKASFWWLRSPGLFSVGAACVYIDGYVFVYGIGAIRDSGGVRPALYLNL